MHISNLAHLKYQTIKPKDKIIVLLLFNLPSNYAHLKMKIKNLLFYIPVLTHSIFRRAPTVLIPISRRSESVSEAKVVKSISCSVKFSNDQKKKST